MHKRFLTHLVMAALALFLPLTALAQQPEDALIPPETVAPWLAPAETPQPEEALTDEQLGTLLSDLGDGEQAEDYLAFPEGLSADPDKFSLLLIGTDGYRPDDPARSDAMMLAQVHLKTGEIKLISFLRDMYVKIPGNGRHRLNSSYMYGGADLLKETLETNFGVHIDRTLAVNFSVMADLVDQIGGVDAEVSESERKQLNSILKYYNQRQGLNAKDGVLEESGRQRLTGKQALCYSRIRKLDSDFKRTERQRTILEAIFARVKALDAGTLTSLLTANLDRVKTDVRLSDALALIPVLPRLQNASFEGMSVPEAGMYQDDVINGMMVLAPNLKKCGAAIASFLE